MRILVEGADQVGKTTFCEKLGEAFGLSVQHMSAPPEGESYGLSHYVRAFREPGVYDRAHMGTIVYGEILGYHKNSLTPNLFRSLENYLIFNECYLFVITAEPKLLSERIQQNNREEMCNEEEILIANLMYYELAEKSQFKTKNRITGFYCDGSSPFPSIEYACKVLRAAFPNFELSQKDGESGCDA